MTPPEYELKTIATLMGTDDRWREDVHFCSGCLANDNFWWVSIIKLYNAMPPDPEIVGADRWLDMWRERLAGAAFWPSPNITNTSLWLIQQTLEADAVSAAELAICSPPSFGAAAGDMCSFAIPGDMAADCRIDAAGALQFKAAPLEDALDILGQPSVDLKVSADQAQGFVVALLVDEAPNGAQTMIARGFCNLNHRISDIEPTPITPGEEMAVTVPMFGTGYRVPPGHRIVLQIASAYWPVLWPAPEPVTLTIRPGQS
ncbi:CocE/NonD family hydrolase C-terminal non-catalytic domain-containing protein [Ruegeria sp. HKCCA5463]|uniref:CocE/NonD family hydrolase C-terminal non-catalytic domain-containing protein n=1 Tax=Ruegeria sp. HKCCA5463 TaxID=2682994 RepID=UPI001C2C2028